MVHLDVSTGSRDQGVLKFTRNRAIRIALLSMHSGYVYRGVESWSAQACDHLAKLGHECFLIQGGKNIGSAKNFKTISVKYERAGREIDEPVNPFVRLDLDKPGRERWIFSALCLAPLTKIKPDLIIPVNSYPAVVAVMQFYRRLIAPQCKILVRTPGGYHRDVRRCIRLGVNGVAASDPNTRGLIERDFKVRTILIPLGIEINKFSSAKPAAIDLDGRIVISTSALIDFKRLHLSIHAVAKAGLSLVLIGDGAEREKLCALGQELLGKRRFLWLPSIPFDQIAGYYKAAHVFTLPSAVEGFGIVVLEALAAGLPVVVTDDAMRRWIVQERGYFIDPIDIESYAKALTAAAAEGNYARPPEYLATFDWSSVAKQWSDFCLATVNEH